MLVENTLNKFVDRIGSTEALPGGGSVAAYNGSMGASLTKMVAILTVGKEKYADYEELNQRAIEELTDIVAEFQKLVDEDTVAFTAVLNAYAYPKETEEDKTERFYKIQDALKGASLVPFETIKLAVRALEITEGLVGKSNTNASGDLYLGSLNLKTALLGSHHNIITNLESVVDDVFRNIYLVQAEELVKKGKDIAEKIRKELV